jgi:hypothetical protein
MLVESALKSVHEVRTIPTRQKSRQRLRIAVAAVSPVSEGPP